MLRGERPVKRWAPCGPSNQHPHGLDTGFEVFEVTSAIHRGAPQRERARPPDPRSRAIVAMMRDDEQSAPPPRPDPARCSITNPHSIRNRGPRRGVRVGIITLSWLLVYQAPDDHSDTDGAHEATDRPAPRGSGPARACTAQSHGHGAALSDHDGGPADPRIPFSPSKTRHVPCRSSSPRAPRSPHHTSRQTCYHAEDLSDHYSAQLTTYIGTMHVTSLRRTSRFRSESPPSNIALLLRRTLSRGRRESMQRSRRRTGTTMSEEVVSPYES